MACKLGTVGAVLLSGAITCAAAAGAEEAPYASGWIKDHASRTRLVAGGVTQAGGAPRVEAGIAIELEDGWKTYWRNPGSSGVPPRIEWAGSSNLAEATLLFPAPRRFTDRDGDTIGYKHGVVLPVRLVPKKADQPIGLKLELEYGVCKDVCIPVQQTLELSLPPEAAGKPAPSLQSAFDAVPRPAATAAGDPILRAVRTHLDGAKPTLELEADFGSADAAAQGDVFLEAPEGLWIPLPKPAAVAPGGVRRFTVDLTDGADIAELKGKSIRATLVAPSGQSEASFKLE